jgi:hypothetical protein
MKKLRRQFGKKFVDILKKSPTLVKNLEEIRANNIKIRAISGYCRAYYDRKPTTIYIGKSCGLAYQLVSLAHEFVHALLKPTNDPIPGVTGKKEFIARCLSEETEAIVHELKIQEEFNQAGVKFTFGRDKKPYNKEWVDCYAKSGRPGIMRKLKTTVTSTTGDKYPHYYALWYDDVIPKDKRLP